VLPKAAPVRELPCSDRLVGSLALVAKTEQPLSFGNFK